MKVKELIDFLQKCDPEMLVAYEIYSEYAVLKKDDLCVAKLCQPRPDGWVQRYRADMPSQEYVLFPGN